MSIFVHESIYNEGTYYRKECYCHKTKYNTPTIVEYPICDVILIAIDVK